MIATPRAMAIPHTTRARRCAARSRTAVASALLTSSAAASSVLISPPPCRELLDTGGAGLDPPDRRHELRGGDERDDQALDHRDDVDRGRRRRLHAGRPGLEGAEQEGGADHTERPRPA